MKNREMERKHYMIYNEMFNRTFDLMKMIRKRLESENANIYDIEVYVGNEETKEYCVYVEYTKNGFYRNVHSKLLTEDEMKSWGLI